MLKIIYMGTPEIASFVLARLCEGGYRPSLVVTQPAKAQGRGQKVEKSHVGKTAEKLKLRCIEAENVSLTPTFEIIQEIQPDLILVVAFGQILKENILKLPTTACLNLHASLLPKYRGSAPVQRAIWNGDTVSGVTIQKMVRKLDAGDIFLTKEIVIAPDETSGELLNRLAELGAEALVEAVKLIESGKIKFQPQDESKVTLAPKISKEEGKIDWNKPSKFIVDQVRALQPWPVAETVIHGTRVKVFRLAVDPQTTQEAPGTLTTDSKSFLKVACGDGRRLSLLEIQPDNRKRMNVAEFLSGFAKPVSD